ncbi:MAG: hypothetical protein AB1938_04125 [Myxococcota bacterium]
MKRLLVASAVLLVGCKATEVTSPGAAGFRDVAVVTPTGPIDSLFAVCWPLNALAEQRVTLLFVETGDVMFATEGGASNSSARCLREIASTWPWKERPKAPVTVGPPTQPIDGWGALAWVRLLSPSRYGPERGLVDPGPLVRACIDRGGGPGPSLRFTVEGAMVKPGFAATEAGRCVEAVLGSTAWPSSRDVFFEFSSLKNAPDAAGDVGWYFAPAGSVGVMLDPQAVRETIREAGPKVSACWNAALARRAGLGGGRSFRFQTDDTGKVTHAWVQGNLAEGPAAADYLLDRCLAEVLKSLRFPGLAGEGMYTWVFATRG